ncbi:TPA: ATP-binding protein [Candidatus Woesearchaeota archaeon]|nr:ATP-binding protein [Candidatus Woesearchaeota archaeon]HIJ13800.1 ATP-binding protein [Candidatus Woesearchaeota archaeon]
MLSENEIKEILIRQKETILNKAYGLERTILKTIGSKIRLPHIVVLTGLRRSGKSTLLRQIIRKEYDDKKFFYINFEDERLMDFPAKEFNRLHEALIGLFGNQKTFFLDEIQNISGFEIFIRRLYEEGFKFFITESSATLLSRELGTKLTGRHIDIIVKPFSFTEFMKFKGIELTKESFYIVEKRTEIKRLFEEYLVNGGMPEYIIYGDPEILSRVYDDVIVKDIAVRYKVSNIYLLRQLYSLLITNFSNRFSYNSIRKIIGIKSVNTIKKYISYIEETYFAKTINKFDYSIRRQIINDKKLYVLDNGFINILSKKVTKDKGWLLENLVFNHLKTNIDIFYHSNKTECDFLIVKNREIINAIQVCYELTDENKEREINGLMDALKKYKLKQGLILTLNEEDEERIKGRKIIIKPVWKWLIEDNE